MDLNFDSFKGQVRGLENTFRGLPALYGAHWGTAATAGVGAAVLAPWLLRNDDRGYAKTALITTPLLAAGFATAPGVWGGLRGTAASWGRMWNAQPFSVKNVNVGWNPSLDMEHKSLADLQVLFDKGALTADEFARLAPLAGQAEQRRQAESFATLFRERKQASVPDLTSAVSNLWDERLAQLKQPFEHGSFQRDMNAALHEARLAAGLQNEGIGALTHSELREHIGAFSSLPEEQAAQALRVMKRRLTTAGNYRVGEEVSIIGHEPVRPIEFRPFADRSDVRKMMARTLGKKDASAVMRRLQNATENGVLDEIQLALQEGKAVGLKIGRHGEDAVTFGFVNSKTRRTLKGSKLQEEAAARLVRLNGGEYDRLDLWLTKNLHQKLSDIQDEIDSHALHSGVDYDDAWSAEHQLDRASSIMPDEVAYIRGGQLSPSRFAIYNGDKKWQELSHQERLAQEEAFRNVGGYFGNEHGVGAGVAHLLEQEELIPGMVASEKQNDPTIRSLTKNRLIDPASVPQALRARYRNEAQLALFKNGTHDFGFTLGQLTPQQVAFFGALPEDVKQLRNFDGTAHIQDAMRTLNPTSSEEELTAMSKTTWRQLRRRFEANPLSLHAARKMGSLGETQFLLHSDFNQVFMKEGAVARVKNFHLNVEPGGLFSDKMVIGYDAAGSEVLSPAGNNVLKSAKWNGDEWVVHYDRHYATETGSKIDAMGKKGLTIKTVGNEFDMNLNTLNLLYGASGHGTPFTSEVKALVNAHYFDPKEASVLGTLGQANDVLTRLHAAGATDIVDRYGADFHKLHVDMLADPVYNHSTNSFSTVFQENTVQALESMKQSGLPLQQAKAARLADLNQLNQRLMREAESYIQAHRDLASKDLVFRGYLSMKRKDYRLQAYLEKFAGNVGQAFLWDTTHADIPKQVGVTYDMYTNMLRNGDLASFKDILMSADPLHGDTREAADWAAHFFQKGGPQGPLGKVVQLDGLHAKTLFDGKSEAFRKNFSIDLGREREFVMGKQKFKSRYVAVRGLDTYKAAANKYGGDKTALTDYQRSLVSLVEAAQGSDDVRLTGAFGRYADTAANDLFGKGGLLRPIESHPNAMALVIASRPTQKHITVPGVEGKPLFARVDPFEIVVSHQQLHRIQDKNLRKELLKTLEGGESVYAKAARHPVNAMPFVKVRMATKADHLGANMVGIDESLRSLINSDDDRDTLNLLFLNSKEAREEARRALTYHEDVHQMSNQWRNLRMVELMQGLNENSRQVKGYNAQSIDSSFFTGSLEKHLSDLTEMQRVGTYNNVTNRLAHAETGLYSNLLTRLHMNLEVHPTLQTSGDRPLLENLFFQIRQVPISASKGKMGFGTGDPRALWEQFQAALGHGDKEEGVEMARDAMQQILRGTGKTTVMNTHRDIADAATLFGVKGLALGETVNLGARSMVEGHGARAIREFVMNRDARVDNAVKLFTQEKINARELQQSLGSLGHAGLLSSFRSGRMADQTASAAGVLNNALRDGIGAIGKALKPAAPILAAGAITAAVFGLMGTNIQSANQHRPEERAGVADRAPGPVEGSSSNRPRVVMAPAPAQTRTMTVAPIQRNNDIEVSATAPDRAAAAETAKMADRLQGTQGPSTVTVNYLGGARDRLSKLRLRQQLRESLDLNNN